MDEVMEICSKALEDAGYEIYGYSACYEQFTVKTKNQDIEVNFSED